ncbi:MAG: methyltransferase domain-containing protein [Alphaproteobacteria bacterium]|nr:methyltransferase domain-containing protein [Alphaproteobacteria bacterium]
MARPAAFFRRRHGRVRRILHGRRLGFPRSAESDRTGGEKPAAPADDVPVAFAVAPGRPGAPRAASQHAGRLETEHRRALRPRQRFLCVVAGSRHDIFVRRVRPWRQRSRKRAGGKEPPPAGSRRRQTRRPGAVTAITVSRAQHDSARRRVQEAGLCEQVDIRLCDYRDLDGEWDHAISIEMIEAVGEKYWDIYFDRVSASVKPGGTFALQAIVIENERFDAYRRSADFIQKHIFPGGALLSPNVLHDRAATAGFHWKTAAGYGLDYAETLACWRERFESAADEVTSLGFDERFRRCWSFYLAYCEGGFRAGNIDVLQVALARK